MSASKEQQDNINSFLLKILVFSLALAAIGYSFIHLGYLEIGWKAFLSIQFCVLVITTMMHIFLVRSADPGSRPQKIMFNFMLATTVKIFVYCGLFLVIVLLGKYGFFGQYSFLQLFVVLFMFYTLYTVFELASIVKFIKKIS